MQPADISEPNSEKFTVLRRIGTLWEACRHINSPMWPEADLPAADHGDLSPLRGKVAESSRLQYEVPGIV